MTSLLAAIVTVIGWVGKALGATWRWTRRHPVATPWILVVILAAVLALQHWDGIRRLRSALAQANAVAEARVEEEQRHAQAGMAVVQITAQAKVAEALAQIPDLKAQLDAAQAEVGRLTLVAIVRAQTAGAKVHAKPRPNEPAMTAQNPDPPVLLRDGDGLKLGIDGAVATGEKGAASLFAYLYATRMSDGEVLSRQPVSAPVTVAMRTEEKVCPGVEPRRDVRVGLEGGGVAGKGGVAWMAGGQVLYRDRWTLRVGGGPGTGAVAGGFLFP